ncbi:MAG: transcriptional repressor [Clostridiales bacterium]|nr:transcriptional repressor [Clostridiales bacterium]
MSPANYNTRQGKCISDILKSDPSRHFTVEELGLRIAALGLSVGQTTIYRRLEKLVNQGEVIKYELPGGGGARFQYAGGGGGGAAEHYHLVCTRCNAVEHLECGHADELTEHLKKAHDFIIDKRKTVFFGHCSRCKAESR